jgi:formate-dependent nitrite reductase membrane component NrfD
MLETTTTNSNPFVDLSHHVWGWEIPVYLFLGGLVAGMMIISGLQLYRGRWREKSASVGMLPLLALVLLSLGMGALFLDLEHKLYVWRLYLTFQWTSPMSWGSWILIGVYPVLLLALVVRPPWPLGHLVPGLDRLSRQLTARPSLVRGVGALSMALGTMLGIYTGILLSSLGARPLWSSAILGPLFLVSGLSTAAALVHMVARDPDEQLRLARADIGFLSAELVLIALFFIGLLSATRVHIEAANLLLGGTYGAVFWVFVVGLGIIVPIFVQTLAVRHRIQHTPVAPLLVLAGGLIFRFVIVYAGQLTRWTPA